MLVGEQYSYWWLSLPINFRCFGFKKTNREISTTGGEIMNILIQ